MPNTYVCIAGGPSLHVDDIQYCREQGWKLATCNMGFRVVPDASLFYAMDGQWWEEYHDELMETINADCLVYTGNYGASCHYQGLISLRWHPKPGWSQDAGTAFGQLSGMHLMQLAAAQGADRIILLGYDCQHTNGRKHYHEDYPEGWKNVPEIHRHIQAFNIMAKMAPVPVINCSRETALECFERVALRAVPRETERSKTDAPEAA